MDDGIGRRSIPWTSEKFPVDTTNIGVELTIVAVHELAAVSIVCVEEEFWFR
jgi:hypothetical protein